MGAATQVRLELLFFGGVSVSPSAVVTKMLFFQTEIPLFLIVLRIGEPFVPWFDLIEGFASRLLTPQPYLLTKWNVQFYHVSLSGS